MTIGTNPEGADGMPHLLSRPTFAVIIPVRDKAQFLGPCLTALASAVAAYATGHPQPSPVHVVVVDNGSRDGSDAVARRWAPLVEVVPSTASTAAGARNDGVAAASAADLLVFLDSDCVVPTDFFTACLDVLTTSHATAVGGEMRARADGHWTERTWDAVHRHGGDGFRAFINSACLCLRPSVFHQVGGFDGAKVSSEDVDFGRRLRAAGGRLFQSERLAVLHLGNPQSLRGVYRRVRWHNEGVIEPGRPVQWSRMMVATIAHGLVAVGGTVAALGYARPIGGIARLGGLLLAWLTVPILFLAARRLQYHRPMPWVAGVLLMSVTFPARWHGMLRGVRRTLAARGHPA